MAPDPFDELYARTFPHVWRALGRRGISAEAERAEVAQDVYLVVHEKQHTRNPKAPELAWVLAIAGNLARNHRTRLRTKKEKPMDDPDAVLDIVSEAPATDETVALRAQYLALVEGMTAERRQVFELHEVEGFTAPEIAATLRVREGTVNTRLRLAREHVKAGLARMEARDKGASSRQGAALLALPFGAGGWRSVRDLFGDVPEGAEEMVWRGARRAIAQAALLAGAGAGGAAGAGAVLAVKASAGVLFGSGFALGGAVVGGVLYLLQSFAPTAPPVYAVPEASRPAAVAAGATTAAPEPTQAPEPIASALPLSTGPMVVRAPAPVTPTATSAASQIDPEEMALIARAQVAFARKDRAGTLEALDAHARKFPRGKLAPERDGIRAKLGEVGGSWAGGATNNAGTPDAGRGRLFGSDD